MPFKLSWYLPKRILLVEMIGVVTVAEAAAFTNEAHELVASGQPLVHYLFDTQAFQKVESIAQTLKIMQKHPLHPNAGWILIIGVTNPAQRFFFDMAGLVTRGRYRRLDTLPEALKFLQDVDQTLDLSALVIKR